MILLKVARPKTNGFVERFNLTVLDKFFREAFRNTCYASVEELQNDLDEWLNHYNYERPRRGYRNIGRRPIETLEAAKKTAFEALITVIEESGEAASPNMGCEDCKSVHIDKWRAVAYEKGISSSPSNDAKKKAFQRAISGLRDGGWIETQNDYWWPARDKGQGRDISGTGPGT